jgi:hypothetical protein
VQPIRWARETGKKRSRDGPTENPRGSKRKKTTEAYRQAIEIERESADEREVGEQPGVIASRREQYRKSSVAWHREVLGFVAPRDENMEVDQGQARRQKKENYESGRVSGSERASEESFINFFYRVCFTSDSSIAEKGED